jgi:subtilase family serine protease
MTNSADRPATLTRRSGWVAVIGALSLALALLPSGLATSAAAAGSSAAPAVVPAASRPSIIQTCPKIPGRERCLSERISAPIAAPRSGSGLKPATSAAPYGPRDLASAYKIPATKTTTTVAIVDAYDAPTVAADLAHYRKAYGLSACTTANKCFKKVDQSGRTAPLPKADEDWAGEATLDVEMVSAACPTCHILLVESTDDSHSNMAAAVKTATNLHARYVSMSWGGSEFRTETATDKKYFNVAGVTYVAAAGDYDYGTSWPAVNPAVVAVGGTSLLRDHSARGWNDSVWGYTDGTGTGSGCSRYETKPSWQSGISSKLCAHRAMNDVSIVGDPYDGVAMYFAGDWYQAGGTSVGAPLIAAMYAMTGRTTGASAYPYAHRTSFNDVTRYANADCGNALCSGGPGWDGPTGVGTPKGLAGL